MTKGGHGQPPKLPAKQLAILAVARFAEPLGLTSVFPYLPEMIQSFGVAEDDVASWAGLTGSVFSIAQSCTAVSWGRASDRVGRKPTILIGLVSTMICFLVWGLSTSLAMAITTRAVMGGGNGNVGIIRTMVAEMVPEKELQPFAFSLMPLVWSIGSVFGPVIGGFCARPAEQFPWLFGNSQLFKTFPFLLPNLVLAVFFFISTVTAALFLKETLETRRHEKDWGLVLGEKLTRPFRRTPKASPRRNSFVDDSEAAPLLVESGVTTSADVRPGVPDADEEKIFSQQVVINMVSYTFLALHSVTFDQILPVFLHYPEQIPDSDNTHLPFYFSGGYGLGSDRIGTIFTIYGIACGLIQFIVFPPLCARFGPLNCYKTAAILFPFLYVAIPYTVLIQNPTLRYGCLLVIMLIKGFAVILGFPCMIILLTNAAPSLRVLGTLNGFATTFSGVGRAAGPAMTGATFTWGVGHGYVTPAWFLLAAIASFGAIPAWFIVEGEGPSRPPEDDDDEEEELQDEDGLDRERVPGSSSDAHAILAGDADDLERLRLEEEILLDEPDTEPDSEPEPLPHSTKTHTLAHVAAPGHVRLRRMSAAGEDLEHDRNDASWRLKQRDDEIEG